MKVQKHQENVGILGITVKTRKGAKMKIVLYLRLIQITANGSRLGEVAEHKTSLELQMFKLKIECQTKH